MTVSHETHPYRPRTHVSRGTGLLLALTLLGALAVACGNPPGPRGWAAPEPVHADSLTLVPHKKTVYGIPKDQTPGADGLAQVTWQFPPRDREFYSISETATNELLGLVNGLGLPDDDRERLSDLVRETNVGGPTVDALKDAIEAAAPGSPERSALTDRLDEVVTEERSALRSIRAFYGDIGVSDDRETAFLASYGGYLFALDVATGETLWMRDLDPMVGGVLVDGQIIYVGTKEGHVYAFEGGNGSLAFERKLDDEIWAAPARAYDGDGIYVATIAGSLYRLSDTFEEMWHFDGADGAIAQRPVVNNDRVYVGAFDNTFYAISADTGKEVWSIEADNWFWGAPVLDGGTVYAASLDGKVYALDAQTGEPAWPRPYSTGNQVRSGLVIAGDALIVGSRDGYVHKVSLENGTLAGQRLRIGTRLEADLSVDDDGNVYAISRNPTLYVIESDDALSAEFFTVTD